jgi:hypothetical protein
MRAALHRDYAQQALLYEQLPGIGGERKAVGKDKASASGGYEILQGQ